MMILYGIKTCDTVRKARKYLQKCGCDVSFFDYDDTPLSEETIRVWIQTVSPSKLFNTRSTVYRSLELDASKLSDDEKIRLMLRYNRLIKRPILVYDDHVVVGFSPQAYESICQQCKG